MTEFDIFIRNDIYPNANAIFTSEIQPVGAIKNDCIYVFDTNALLLPYYGNSKNLASIKSILSYLIKKKRLFIPGQAAREFAANRPDRIKEIFQTLNQQINLIKEFKTFKYPILDEISAYNELTEIEQEYNSFIIEARARYKSKVNEVLKAVKDWTWNDPVSSIYRELFSEDVVIDLEFSKDELKKELARRFTHKIPPGYKDQAKPDDGIGDLLIWKTILNLGEKLGKNLIFVSGEEKADWLYKSEGQILYPRYELVYEYHNCSKGKSFHILKYSEFLELMSGAEELISEMERIEFELIQLDYFHNFPKDYGIHVYDDQKEFKGRLNIHYLVSEELQIIRRLIELHISMNESDTFKLQDRFIDSITMTHRSGFVNYDTYKRLMHIFTRDNWDSMAEGDLWRYHKELQDLRQHLTTKVGFAENESSFADEPE